MLFRKQTRRSHIAEKAPCIKVRIRVQVSILWTTSHDVSFSRSRDMIRARYPNHVHFGVKLPYRQDGTYFDQPIHQICSLYIVNRLDRRWVLLTTRFICRGDFLKCRVWGKVPEESTLIYGDTRISQQHSVGYMKNASMSRPARFVQWFRYNTAYREQRDRRTDGHKTTANLVTDTDRHRQTHDDRLHIIS